MVKLIENRIPQAKTYFSSERSLSESLNFMYMYLNKFSWLASKQTERELLECKLKILLADTVEIESESSNNNNLVLVKS